MERLCEDEYPREIGQGDASFSVGTSAPTLYVITVNFHSFDYCKALIRSLSTVKAQKQLIIVNHSSSEDLTRLEADFPIQVIEQENRGYAAGLNRGLREIPHDDAFVLICNPDIVILTPDTIPDIWRYMERHPKVSIVVPRLVNREGRPVPSCRMFYSLSTLIGARVPWPSRRMAQRLHAHYYLNLDVKSAREVDWGSGAALFARLSALKGINFLDEKFFLYFEDVDLCARMWQQGYAVIYFPEMTCRHDEQCLSRRKPFYLVRHLASLFRFAAKFRGLPQREQLIDRKASWLKCL